MIAPRIRGALFFSLAVVSVVAAACGNSGTEPNGGTQTTLTPLTSITADSGNGQIGTAGVKLPKPIFVTVTKNQLHVGGATVTFAVTKGAATLSPSTATTDVNGQASTNVTLGAAPGAVVVTATVSGANLVAVFNLGAGSSTSANPACQSTSATTPVAGGVITDLTGTGICLGGGATGAQYALVAFYANPDSTQVANLSIRSTGGVTQVASAAAAPAYSVGPTIANARALAGTSNLQASFSAHLREMSRRQLTSRIPGARLAALRQPSFTAIPANPTVGTLVSLNAQGNDPCDHPIMVTARVAAVSNLAIVVADTANPVGGFTDAQYKDFATTFDTLISPIDIANFGAPSDIDKNGKTIIFFTKEVNKLTPRGSIGVVGGFFFERDLFPVVATPDIQACPGSNVAEMYYSLVPDPNAVYSDARSASSVRDLTPGTLAHEFQHLINASRRIYVNNAASFEETWLNEGLSHIAEELLYYHVAGLTPRANITFNVLARSQAAVDAFNKYQGDNTGRYQTFLAKPNQTSVYADNDSLETRGATWNLLRYLADHRGTADADTWSLLVNTAMTGQQNVANVFGTDYMTQIRNWATSVFADDLAGQADVRFSQPSWNYRDIFPNLVDDASNALLTYPLKVFPLSDKTPVSTSVNAGGVAYFRFAVPANTSASIDWASTGIPVSTLMQFTVVRSK